MPGLPPGGDGGDIQLRGGVEPLPGYRLLARLGKGSFGEVWRAESPGGFEVALKFVHLDDDAGNVEARALEVIKRVRHPHLLAPFGAWQLGDWLVIGMELADRSLMDRFREAAAQGLPGIPVPELTDYMLEAAKGIDYLNEPHPTGDGADTRGIQHRDIKPQNLLLVGGGVKVADFGLVRLLEHSLTGHTGGMTPAYAAPEFFNRQTASQSDQYCLAITYCHLRGGRLPFTGSFADIMAGHLMREPDLSMLPGSERPTVARALAKNPKERWPDCRGFAAALRVKEFDETNSSSNSVTSTRVEGADLLQSLPRSTATEPAGVATDLPRKPAENESPRANDGVPGSGETSRPAVTSPPEYFTTRVGQIKLKLIPAGEFMMGSPANDRCAQSEETPQHLVRITKPFYLGITQVTRGQFRLFIDETGYETEGEFDGKGGYGWNMRADPEENQWQQNRSWTWENPGFQQSDEHPVVNVSWNDAHAFVAWLSKIEERAFRLPTEAEWEYACRAGTTTRYCSGNRDESLFSVANIGFDAGLAKEKWPDWATMAASDGLRRTIPVGWLQANAFGLYDMHGNVQEWCEDEYERDYYKRSPVDDPPGGGGDPPGAGGSVRGRVVRGGSFRYAPNLCRSARRFHESPAYRCYDLGFRLALDGHPASRRSEAEETN
jgi:formylglycine-generating enzyme required for sulfatase activity